MTDIINDTLNITNTEINYTELYNASQQTTSMLTYLLIFIIVVTIGLVLLYYFVIRKNQEKELQKALNQGETATKLKEYIQKLEEIDKEDKDSKIYTRKININDLPEDLKKELIKDTAIYKAFEDKAKDKHQQPWLLLMKRNGEIEIKTDVKEGLLPLTNVDGTKKWLDIEPHKRGKLVWGEDRIDCYIGSEDEAELYPHTPKHHGLRFYMIVEALQLNKGRLEGEGGFNLKWVIIIGIAVILIGIGYYVFTKDQAGAATIIQNATENITQNATTAKEIIIN